MMALDRARLKEVFSDKGLEPQLCSYSERLDSGLPFNNLIIENVGDITIPMSFNAFEEIKAVYHNKTVTLKKVQIYHTQTDITGGNSQPSQYHTLVPCIVDGKHLLQSSNNSFFHSESFKYFTIHYLEKMYQVQMENIDVCVDAQIDSLVMLVNAQSYARVFNWEKQPGSFGYMLIKLPVEGDNGQGHITATYKDEVKTYELGTQPSVFMVSGMRQGGRQDFEIRQAPGSRAAFLIFNLVWKNAYQLEHYINPCGFPAVIKGIREINDTLSVWKTDAPRDAFLCIPLLNHYSMDELNLDGLKGADTFIARTLLSLEYIQVHFATITSPAHSYVMRTTKEPPRVMLENVKQLSVKWMSSKDSWNTPPQNIVVDEHLVGEITSKIFPIDHDSSPVYKFSYDSDEEEGNSEIDGFGEYQRAMGGYYNQTINRNDHPVLLIRPKWTFLKGKIDIKPAMADLDMRFTDALKRLMHGELLENDVYLVDFHKLICYIANASNKIEKVECIDSWPLLKLLFMAQRLQRFSHGLKVLEVIADRKCLCGAHDVLKAVEHFARRDLEYISFMFSERGRELAQDAIDGKSSTEPYVGEFVIRAGWQRSSAAVLRMLDNREPSAFFVSLAKRLYFNRFIDGMLQVVDKLIGKMTPSDECRENPAVLIESMAQLYIQLHRDGFVGSQKFYDELLPAMKRYDFSILWCAFESLKKKLKEEQETAILSKILIELGHAVLNCDLNSMSVESFLAIVKEYTRLDIKVVDGVWKKTLNQTPTDSKKVSMLQRMIVHLTTNEERTEVLNTVSLYPEANQALDSIVSAIVQQIPANNGKGFELNHSSRYDEFKQFFQFVTLAKEYQQFHSPQILEAMKLWATKLGVFTLIRVLRDIRNELKTQIVAGQRALIYFMLQELARNLSTVLQIAESTIKEVVHLFLWFGDTQLTESLIVEFAKVDVMQYPLLDERLKTLFELGGICGEPVPSQEAAPAHRLARNQILYLLRIWFQFLISRNEPARVNKYITDLFRVYCSVETYQSGAEDKTLSSLFLQCLPLLTSATLKLLTFETFNGQTSLKGNSSCFEVYRAICSQLMSRPEAKDMVSSDGMQLMDCFLWTGDQVLIGELVETLCSSSAGTDVSVRILKSERTQQLAKTSQVGLKAFNDLLDDCINKLNDPSSRVQTWAIADATIPALPNGLTNRVQKFLRDPNRWTESFGCYKTELGARNLGFRITAYRPSWGLRFMTVDEGGSFKCQVTKQRKFDGGPAAQAFNKELPSLRALKNKMSTAAADPAHGPSPPKRQKTEGTFVITL